MRGSNFFVVGFVVAVLIVLSLILVPFFVSHNPTASSLAERLLAPGTKEHLLGTDQLGRDVLSRLMVGGRFSLMISILVVTISCLLGTTVGIIAGYVGGKVDMVIMRLCDVFLSIPSMVLAIAVMAILGTSTFNLVMVLIIGGWVQYCKVTRNNVLVIKSMEFTKASKVFGANNRHIMFTQILPNVTTPLIILFTCQIGETIMLEAGLSFLSLGIQPPEPSWGNMIAGGRDYLATNPWLILAPGIALMITVLAFNFLGDGLRDVLDPKRT